MANNNNSTIPPVGTSGPDLTPINHAPGGALSEQSASEPPTPESVRLHATKAAAVWNSNEDDLRATTTLLEWRDNCRDEIRDEILVEIEGTASHDRLLAAWADTFDGATGVELTALRAAVSESRDEVDCAVDTAAHLLRLAIDEGIQFEPAGNRANSAIRAAMRYLDDIGRAVDLIDGWTMADGGAA